MSKYTIPEPKKSEEMNGAVPSMPESRPTVYFPANKELLAEVEIGREIEICAIGKVTAISEREKDRSFDLELISVEASGNNEFEKMAREDEEEE